MSKKKKNKIKHFIRKVIILLLFLIIILVLIIKLPPKNNKLEILNINKDKLIEEEKQEDYKISLIMVGDNLIHDSIYKEANKNANYNGYDFKKMYELIKPIVKEYDIAYYNQETILGGTEIGLSSYPNFNSPYEVGDAMIDAGFNLVSLATNHTLDRGEQAIINSRNYWNNKENVTAVGSYLSKEEQKEILILEKNNISYALLNYTYGTNGMKRPVNKEYLVNIWPMKNTNVNNDTEYQKYKETVKEEIESIRDKVDLLMVAMHWGVEYQYEPNSYEKDAAEFLSSLGVDIIIGTHPHVIQPIEYINNTLVIYSLGNFASAHEVVNIGNRIGLMSSLEITKDYNTGKISIDNLENELLYMYYTSNYNNFKIVPFSMINNEYLSNYEEIYQKFSKIVKGKDESIYVKPLG